MERNLHNQKAELRENSFSRRAPEVSIFRLYFDNIPMGTVSLSEVVFSTRYEAEVVCVRRERDPARRRELKSRLPAITPSGVFSKRYADGLVRHSGFICLDLDGKDNPRVGDWEALKSSLADLQGLWYAGLSVSGNGLFLLVKIARPDRHAEHFHALDCDLRLRGLVVDSSCRNVDRLRGASYDANPLYFPDAEPYETLLAPMHTSDHRAPAMPQNGDFTALRVARFVETIERTGTDITGSYADWFAVGRSLAAEFGERGRNHYHAISCNHPEYTPAETDRQFDKCLRACSRTSISTLFWLCKRHGITAQ